MNKETIYVIPADNMIVRDPVTTHPIPAEGSEVPRTSYWLRRLRDESVRLASKPPRKSRATSKEQ